MFRNYFLPELRRKHYSKLRLNPDWPTANQNFVELMGEMPAVLQVVGILLGGGAAGHLGQHVAAEHVRLGLVVARHVRRCYTIRIHSTRSRGLRLREAIIQPEFYKQTVTVCRVPSLKVESCR